MKLSKEHIERLREMLARPGQRIVVVSHTNPDGDAVGSSLAWAEVLRTMGHAVTCVVPNKYPYFLDWMPGIDEVVIFKTDTEGRARRAIAEADMIFCLDFNAVSRLEILSDTIAANTTARRVLIDHHLSPDEGFDLMFSHPDSSSTCFLVYSIVEAMCGAGAITRRMAESLYVGMMTDTGNFAFSFLTPELFRAVAVLVEKGISIPDIHNSVYNAYTEGRARLFGYAINRKMEVIQDGTVAYMSLLENEMRRFQFQQGDSEGFVNYALTIKKVKMSAMFLAHRKFIRVSLRSRGDVDVNLFARKYFSGGGHKNAAGGKSFVSMQETIDHYVRSVRQLFTRRGSHLELTDAGRTMLEAAGRLLDDYRRLEYEMSLCADQTGGELRLGASTTIAQYLLPPILAHFTARFPGVRVSMSSGNSAEVEQALGEHAVDLGLVESLSRRQGLHYTLFRPDELVLVARPGGKYARRETVTPEELPRIPLVLRESGSGTLEVIAAAIAARGIRLSQLDVTMRLGSTEGIKAFVRNSDAMAIVSVISVVDELRSGALRIVDIEGLTLSRDFVFVHAEAEPARLARRFIDFARADF